MFYDPAVPPPNRDGRPDFKITDNGSPIANDVVADVIQITVDDTTDEASLATIKISDKGFRRSDGSILGVGNEVKIELGYVGDTMEVFAGEVTGWRGAYPRRGGGTLTIVAQDKFHRLRRNRRSKTHTNVKDSDAVTQAGQAAGLTVEVGAPTAVTQDSISQFNQTDADFILQKAKANGYEASFEKGKLKFRKPNLDAAAASTLKWHEELRSFTAVLKVAGQQADVKVSAWDMKQKAPISATATKGEEGSLMGGSVTGTDAAGTISAGTQWYPNVSATTQAAVDAMAKAAFAQRSQGFVTGQGTCQGDYSVTKGCVVQVDEIGDFLSGPYYVTRAIHTLLIGGGYTTTFFVKRTAVKKPPPPPVPVQGEPVKPEEKKAALLDPDWEPPGGIVADVIADPQGLETMARAKAPGLQAPIQGQDPTGPVKPPEVQTIRFKIEDQDGTPLGNKPFELAVGGQIITGITRNDGYVIADVPADVTTGELTFWLDEDKSGDSYTWPLKIADHTGPAQ